MAIEAGLVLFFVFVCVACIRDADCYKYCILIDDDFIVSYTV
jgi:hypothetical protein